MPELRETEHYSEIIFEDEMADMYVTATKSHLEFYCKDTADDVSAYYQIPWKTVPQFMEQLNKVVDKWFWEWKKGLEKE